MPFTSIKIPSLIFSQSANLISVSIKDNEGIADSPTFFIFKFSENISETFTPFTVTFSIDEDKIIRTTHTITKALIPHFTAKDEAIAQLIFPEELAGASLTIRYSFFSKKKIISKKTSFIKIKLADNSIPTVTKVYWAEQQHPIWDRNLTERKEICIDEVGFMHIYSKGMFGHEVWIDVKEEKENKTADEKKHKVGHSYSRIRNNILSVEFSMADVLSRHKINMPGFNDDKLNITGMVFPTAEMKPIDVWDMLGNYMTLHCNQTESPPSQLTNTPPTKVLITKDEEEPPSYTQALCSLQFRPNTGNTGYKGEYGFDWIRMGDADGAPGGYHTDYDFENHMGKHYITATKMVENDGNLHGDAFKKDIEPNEDVLYNKKGNTVNNIDNTFGSGKMFKRLTSRYRSLIFPWLDPNDRAFRTYVPIMTFLLDKDASGNCIPKTARLTLHWNIRERPDSVVIELIPNNPSNPIPITLAPNFSNLNTTGNNGNKQRRHGTLDITCTGEFEEECTLLARAITNANPRGEVCGMIRILPNAVQYQHRIKIVFIRVKTHLSGSTPITGECTPEARIKMINTFAQALVIPEFIEKHNNVIIEIDTTSPQAPENNGVNFKTSFCDGNKIENRDTDAEKEKAKNMKEFLLAELSHIYGGKYDNYYKIFFMKEEANTLTHGYSLGKKYTICFKGIDTVDMVPIHEILHSLNLEHPFNAYDPNTPFSYEYCKTDNIMDYTQSMDTSNEKKSRSLFHWQWQIINSKIR